MFFGMEDFAIPGSIGGMIEEEEREERFRRQEEEEFFENDDFLDHEEAW